MYGRQIGFPELKPHDLRHGVAMEVYGQHHDLEQVRGLLGTHTSRDDAGVGADPAAAVEASGELLRSEGAGGVELNQRTRRVF